MTGNGISPRKELTIVVLLNALIVKPSSKYLFLYSWVSAAFNLGQRSFFWQWAVVDAETHNCSGLNGTLRPSSVPGSRNIMKRRRKEWKS